MGEYNLMICRTCKTMEWYDRYDLPEYIQKHRGHDFTILQDGTLDEHEEFRDWLLKFMGWPIEEETKDG